MFYIFLLSVFLLLFLVYVFSFITSVLLFGLDLISVISGKYLECMQRQDHRALLPFDPEPERTFHRIRREARVTQSEIMQHQVDEGKIHDRDEPHEEQNGQNHRNPATTPFVQPYNLHMLLEEFALPPTVVQ